MESLMSHSACLKNLQHQAKKLATDSVLLVDLFGQEASRLNRQEQVSCLKMLHSYISRQLEQAKRLEIAASSDHSKVKLVASTIGLVVGTAIKVTSENKRVSAFSDYLLKNLGGNERPFGMVLVSIGPRGLPDDVQVVSISELARKSNREEYEVISELEERGQLLLSQEACSRLIDRLITDVQEGQLTLPVPIHKLAEISTPRWIMLKTEKPR